MTSKRKPLVAHTALVPRNMSAEGVVNLVLLAPRGALETTGGNVCAQVTASRMLRGERRGAVAPAKSLCRPVEQHMRREAGPAGKNAAANGTGVVLRL